MATTANALFGLTPEDWPSPENGGKKFEWPSDVPPPEPDDELDNLFVAIAGAKAFVESERRIDAMSDEEKLEFLMADDWPEPQPEP